MMMLQQLLRLIASPGEQQREWRRSQEPSCTSSFPTGVPVLDGWPNCGSHANRRANNRTWRSRRHLTNHDPKTKNLDVSDAKCIDDKEWNKLKQIKLKHIKAEDETNVRSKDEVISKAQASNNTVHFAGCGTLKK